MISFTDIKKIPDAAGEIGGTRWFAIWAACAVLVLPVHGLVVEDDPSSLHGGTTENCNDETFVDVAIIFSFNFTLRLHG